MMAQLATALAVELALGTWCIDVNFSVKWCLPIVRRYRNHRIEQIYDTRLISSGRRSGESQTLFGCAIFHADDVCPLSNVSHSNRDSGTAASSRCADVDGRRSDRQDRAHLDQYPVMYKASREWQHTQNLCLPKSDANPVFVKQIICDFKKKPFLWKALKQFTVPVFGDPCGKGVAEFIIFLRQTNAKHRSLRRVFPPRKKLTD